MQWWVVSFSDWAREGGEGGGGVMAGTAFLYAVAIFMEKNLGLTGWTLE